MRLPPSPPSKRPGSVSPRLLLWITASVVFETAALWLRAGRLERRVRGAVERTYVLRVAAASINLDELDSISREDHRHAFMAFVAGLLGDVDRYLSRDRIDPLRDGVGYRIAGLWLDDVEHAEFVRELTRVIQPRVSNAPSPGRRRRILGTVLLLGEDAPE